MDYKLEGIGFITGAASGIGKKVALAFAAAGISHLYLVDINKSDLDLAAKATEDIASNPEYSCTISTADIGIEENINTAVEDARQRYGRIDYAVNSAGVIVSEAKPLSDTETKDFDLVDRVNNRGLFLSLRAELRQMKIQTPIHVLSGRPQQRGVIVNVASAASIVAITGHSSYTASKRAAVGLTATAAADHAADGIRVNSVSPGYIETPLIRRSLEETPGLRTHMESGALLKRLGQPEEVADAILFLISARASFITGHNLVIDGGFSTL